MCVIFVSIIIPLCNILLYVEKYPHPKKKHNKALFELNTTPAQDETK